MKQRGVVHLLLMNGFAWMLVIFVSAGKLLQYGLCIAHIGHIKSFFFYGICNKE
jgi:hypothetical protein